MGRAVLTPDTIVTAAATVCDEVGYESLTLANLSQRLGVKPPSIYKHLDGLEAVQQGVALMGLRDLNSRLMRAMAGATGADAVVAVALAYWQYSLDHPGVYAGVVGIPPNATGEISAEHDLQIGLCSVVLSGCSLQGDRLRHTVRGLRSLLQGFCTIQGGGGFADGPDPAGSLVEMVRAVVRAQQGFENERPSIRLGPFRLGMR